MSQTPKKPADDIEAEDRPVGARRDAVEERDRKLEHMKQPSPPDLDTHADHATGVRPPD
jgi:hypothetical protein